MRGITGDLGKKPGLLGKNLTPEGNVVKESVQSPKKLKDATEALNLGE